MPSASASRWRHGLTRRSTATGHRHENIGSMSLEVSDQRGARWVKLLQLLDMDLTYDREERLWWSTAIIHGHTRPTALAVIDLADLSRASWDSALTELFEHAGDASWDGDIWIVAAGRLIQPGLDPGWGPEFQASGWICHYHGDLPGEEGWAAAPAPWADCTACGLTGTFHPEQTFLCTPNGCYDAGSNFEPADLDQLRMSWEEAAFGPLH